MSPRDEPHLLIVDDNSALARLLRMDFEELGYRVSVARSCSEGRRLLAASDFDLLLVDYHLPDAKGTELVELCRSRRPELPIILSSAESAPKNAADAPYRFIRKPVGAGTLDLVFRTLLGPCPGA
jgi:DNA-binding NtrC family response regulator